MPRDDIPAEVEWHVRQAARHCCGYCLSPQRLVIARLEIEHIIPVAAVPQSIVGWCRTIPGIVRPTDSHSRIGGPRVDKSTLGTTLHNTSTTASVRPKARAQRTDSATAVPQSVVGWCRTILGIVRPTDSRSRIGGPRVD